MNARRGKRYSVGIAFLFTICAFGSSAQEAPPTTSREVPIARPDSALVNSAFEWTEIVAHARPAVVVIETDEKLGSGFVIKPDGIIVTNHHVVANARAMTVKFESGEVYRNVYLLSSDPINDLAFLKVEAVDLPTILLGNSNDVQVGEDVLLVGAPRGLEQTVSSGLISGIRLDEGVRVLQTSAAASSGSSGGPLLNRKGEAIGVMSFKVVNGENLNFTIPINYVRGKLDSLTLSNAKTFAPLQTRATAKHGGVWVAGYGSTAFQEIFMGVIDILSSGGVEIANNGLQKVKNTTDAGFVTLSTLIENLSASGADSLLYVKTESSLSLGRPTATVYFQCFDATGRLLWEEKASDVLANGGNTLFHPKGWKNKLTRHIGKPGLLLKKSQGDGSPESKK